MRTLNSSLAHYPLCTPQKSSLIREPMMSRPALPSLGLDTICPSCLDLDLEKYGKANSGQYCSEAVLLQDILTSANLGCKECQLLAFAVEPYARQHGSADIVATERNSHGQFFCRLYREPKISIDGEGHGAVEARAHLELGKIWVDESTDTTWPQDLPVSERISGYTGSNESVIRASRWLETCISEHRCRGLTHAPLTTKVLRIEATERVQLHIPDEEVGSYACLSHCWGDRLHSPLKTTNATLEAFQAEVPWSDLPETFRHAISFCFRLGIFYHG
ncbi:hypothetical protein FB567DRAFT_333233 [Paraphoma chrysanthemicola]|uniref:Heterokaryon incompatibility domain-containing protein n=1 Tax=Paraphoma chrysanthemicola TaxID=798071 RepID=A0A8K0R8X6_9PLEO|nr:hypothetical protein FB567DRAFT_333233 [Paraphoma chrysanthemicola]